MVRNKGINSFLCIETEPIKIKTGKNNLLQPYLSSRHLLDDHNILNKTKNHAETTYLNIILSLKSGSFWVRALQDTTTIMFYNKPIFSNILEVLGKQFQFPAVVTRNFQLKTYVDKNKCILKIDRAIMSISATGPGHILWKEKCFKNLAESLFRTYVDQTNTVLETRRNNYTLSCSQDSTQNPDDNEFIIDETVEEPEAETPAGAVAQQAEQVVFTHLQDSMVLRKISVLMDMISSMQSEMSKLTKEVNDLAAQHVASQTLYRTVDETNASLPSLNQSAEKERWQQQVVQEEVPENN